MASENAREIRSVRITCDLLDALERRGYAGVTELATVVDHSKSTVYNHLQTLDAAGYVTREGTDYRLSYRRLRTSRKIRDHVPSFGAVQRALDELATETGEMALFSTVEDGRIVYIEQTTDWPGNGQLPQQVEAWPVNLYEASERTGDVLPTPGSTDPVHCTAPGKAMLAQMDPDEVEAILEQHDLDQQTHNTITLRETLFEELAKAERRGYAVSQEENVSGIGSIAVAVLVDEEFVGAVSLLGPINRMQNGRCANELHEVLVRQAGTIGELVA